MNTADTQHEPITVLMGRVIASVGAVAKRERNQQQGFNFRGIDGVLNAVGPALREHGVFITSTLVDRETEVIEVGKNRTQMAHVVLRVDYSFHGPAGDKVTTQVVAEAMDSGDKTVSKAWSVALRTCLLQTFAIPTDEPDPDSQTHERSPARDLPADAAAMAGAVLKVDTLDEVRAQWAHAQRDGLLDVPVLDPVSGGELPLRDLLKTRGDELAGTNEAPPTTAAETPYDLALEAFSSATVLEEINGYWRRAAKATLLDVPFVWGSSETTLRTFLTGFADKLPTAEQIEAESPGELDDSQPIDQQTADVDQAA